MEKIERVKSIIYQIVGENIFLLDNLALLKNRDYPNLIVNIESDRGSDGSYNNGNINIGVLDIVDSYNLSRELTNHSSFVNDNINKSNFFVSALNEDIRYLVNVGIPGSDVNLATKQLEDSDFLKQDEFSINDQLSIYSLAYSIFHEIGHVIHDVYIPKSEAFTRERIADLFAFEAIKSLCKSDDAMSDVRLKGAIIGIGQMLMYLPSEIEKNEKEHPHSIERLYSLLDFWGIPYNSYYWEYAYKIVQKWTDKNHIPIIWERESSRLFKDKLTDAYIRFRKNPQK